MAKNKIVIFGTGKLVCTLWESLQLDKENIVCFIDNNTEKQGKNFMGKTINSPEEISRVEYDYILILSKYFEEMYRQLVEKENVRPQKIMHWRFFQLVQNEENSKFLKESLYSALRVAHLLECEYVLDLTGSMVRTGIFSRNSVAMQDYAGMHMDAILNVNEAKPFYQNIYENIYTTFDECSRKKYDAVLLHSAYEIFPLAECVQYIENAFLFTKYVILELPYLYDESDREWIDYDYEQLGKVHRATVDFSPILIIESEPKTQNRNSRIYVVTHKEFTPPQSKLYTPIQVGSNLEKRRTWECDSDGESIAELNPIVNECTALYWIWKNANAKYVGLNHYRRFFLRNRICERWNILDEETALKLLNKYDIIVMDEWSSYPRTIEEFFMETVQKKAYIAGRTLILKYIEETCPEYIEAFHHVFNGYTTYNCNIFFTRKEIMDQYCEWLFPIIIPAAKAIDVSTFDDYSKRIIGFFAERLLTVWLVKQKYRMKELPVYFDKDA